tara:strand:- start:97 stop:321 length:225 start_codon:yes stop_codon:yes gene_type:complete
MAKVIELITNGGRVQSFEIGHAVRLLSLKKCDWKFPTESEFEFVNNAIRKKSSPRTNPEPTEKKPTRKRRKASK